MAGEWRKTTLGEVIELKRGYDLPTRSRRPGPYPVVSSSGTTDMHAEFKAAAPGVVTGRYGTIGEVYYITTNYWPLNTTLYVRDFKGNDPRFINYFLRGIDFASYSDKSAVPGVNRNHLHQAKVKIPPLPVQRRIADVLGKLDDKIELNRRMNRTLEKMAAAIFKSWFIDFDPVRAKAGGRDPGLPDEIADLFPDSFEDTERGPIPKRWAISTLGPLCAKPQYGYTASASETSIGPRFLRITDINKQPWIDWETVPFCEADDANIKKYLLKAGDIVIARMADPGHAALIEEERGAVFASYLIRFRPLSPEFDRYLQYWLRSKSYWNLIHGWKTGSTRATLNANVLSELPLIRPSAEVASAFREQVAALRKRVVHNVRHSTSLAALRDTLLPKLLNGEIEVREAMQSEEVA